MTQERFDDQKLLSPALTESGTIRNQGSSDESGKPVKGLAQMPLNRLLFFLLFDVEASQS